MLPGNLEEDFSIIPISNFPKARDVPKALGFVHLCDLCDFYIYVNVVQYGQQA